MYSTHFPNGRKEAELRFKTPLRGKYLYLLHALCWGNTGRTGELEITSSTGKTRTVDVIGGRHVDRLVAGPRTAGGVARREMDSRKRQQRRAFHRTVRA